MAAKRDDSLQPEIGRHLCRVRTEGGIYRGYKKDILTENLSERDNAIFVCPRCKGILRELCMSTDGEQFCSCKKEGEQTTPNVYMNNMILCFKCCYPLMVGGCGWLGTLKDCENHLDTCGYVQEKCRLKCGVVLQRNNHVTHEKENCIRRNVKCEHCKENFKFRELTEHLDRDCKEKEIECPFVKYKCVRLIKRQNLNAHLVENETEHLKMKLNAIEDIVMKQGEMIEKQNVKIIEQGEMVDMQNREIETMSHDIISLKKCGQQLQKLTNPITFNWEIACDVISINKTFTEEKVCDAFGYSLQFNLMFLDDSLLMDFCLKDRSDYDRLDWPFRAKFAVHFIIACHSARRETKEFKSGVIEVERNDLASNFRIATIPFHYRFPFLMTPVRVRAELKVSIFFC